MYRYRRLRSVALCGRLSPPQSARGSVGARARRGRRRAGYGRGPNAAKAHFMKFEPALLPPGPPGPRDMDMDMGIWGIVTASR